MADDSSSTPEVDEGLILDDSCVIDYGDIEVESEIDAGCFGAVYKGTYCGTPVAIKAIFDCSNQIVQKLLRREIAALKNMRHPNIVQFMGTCTHKGGAYIITEFVDGGNLWDILRDESLPLPWSARIKYTMDICQALLYLHKRGFVHRDLKSKNLLYDKESNRLKVCDFGFARTVNNEQGSPKKGKGGKAANNAMYMTKTGTGLWMAPEVVLGLPYSEKADIFSFGTILLEIITRKKPPVRVPNDHFGFNAANVKATIPRDCPPPFFQLCMACVALNAEKRPTAEYIHTYLKKLLPAMVKYESEKSLRAAAAQNNTKRSASPPAAAPADAADSALHKVPVGRPKGISGISPLNIQQEAKEGEIAPGEGRDQQKRQDQQIKQHEMQNEQQEQQQNEQQEKEKLEKEKQEKEKQEKEQQEKLKQQEERREKERQEKEKQQKEQQEKERSQREEQEQKEKEQLMKEQQQKEEAQRQSTVVEEKAEAAGSPLYPVEESIVGDFAPLAGASLPKSESDEDDSEVDDCCDEDEESSELTTPRDHAEQVSICPTALGGGMFQSSEKDAPTRNKSQPRGKQPLGRSSSNQTKASMNRNLSGAGLPRNQSNQMGGVAISPHLLESDIESGTPPKGSAVAGKRGKRKLDGYQSEGDPAGRRVDKQKKPFGFDSGNSQTAVQSVSVPAVETVPLAAAASSSAVSESAGAYLETSAPRPIVSLSALLENLVGYSDGKRFMFPQYDKIQSTLGIVKKRIEERFAIALVDGCSGRAMAKAVKLPSKVDKLEWLAANFLEQYMLINQLFMSVMHECTESSCPVMTASPSIAYSWGEARTIPAPEYVKNLKEWVADILSKGQFPTQGNFNKKSFMELFSSMVRKTFRVFCHIYFAHWRLLQAENSARYFKVIYTYTWHFVSEFKLLDKKAHSTTLTPMDSITKEIKEKKSWIL